MKSFNRIIHTSEDSSELQSWTPADFGSNGEGSDGLFAVRDMDLFNVVTHVDATKSSPSSKVIHKNSEEGNFKSWQPGSIFNPVENSQNKKIDSWTPFIEEDTPQKIAVKVIDEARIQAEEIINHANLEADRIREEAQAQGFQNAKAETRESLEAVNTLISVARDWRADMMSQAEQMVLDLVKKIGQKIFGEGLVLENSVLQQHFAEVLESARALGDLRIYMNPADASELGPDWREFQSSVLGHKVDIISNDSIKRGGCYIQGEWGTADALVETQLEAIMHQFSEVESPTKEDEE